MTKTTMSILEELCVEACLAAHDVVAQRSTWSTSVARETHEVDPDDEVIQIDRATGSRFLEVLARAEIAMDVVIEERLAPQRLPGRVLVENLTAYIDPFDGSKLFKRGFHAFWVSAMGFVAHDRPLASGVVEHVERVCYSSDGTRAQRLDLARGRARRSIEACPEVTRVADWYVGAYAMAPQYFLRAHEVLGPLITAIRCFIPNGGPMGFVDVLTGKLDLYIGLSEAVTEVLPSLALAQAGRLHVVDLAGMPLSLVNLNRRSRVDFLCAPARETIERALTMIRRGGTATKEGS